MTKIYTKSGDKGETSLVSGTRVSKSHLQIDTYGEVDELNSQIGFLISLVDEQGMIKNESIFLTQLQNKLFDIGSILACEPEHREKFKLPQVSEQNIKKLESQIDSYSEQLSPLKNFILPGGSKVSAQAHICRTVCRRVERKLVLLGSSDPNLVPKETLEFFNRLSDFMFTAARFYNMRLGIKDVEWQKSLF